MKDLLLVAYPWIKALHVFSVILWMGAQFVLPLLLMVLRDLRPVLSRAAMLADIERHLIRWVMNPAIVAAFFFGGLMVYAIATASGSLPRWLVLKLVLVFALAVLHGKFLRQFWLISAGCTQWSLRGYRLAQGLNFGLLAGVVVLVVIKPFS